ncbi:MAG: prepilin-type N-terminal cleavage/methylation domain-containing protein [Verrucomicrobiota bacterium]|jgi:prepilin-type N-terminal cleavage/methylation domain-containing protein/prepilin-type processing-associated H-X9-DG protein|nr:prepilin-type N-terminal cleavage/methylation domain-containing protein [Verrucomicrobiota bacterium]
MNKKHAFTLIELLVVIAIIALLAAIIIPVAGKGIELAKRASCANNLKSLGTVFLAYANDHQGVLPHITALPAIDDPKGFQEVRDFTAIVTHVYTNDYVKDLRLWVCPSDKWDLNMAPVGTATSIETFSSQAGNCSYMYISGHHLLRALETPALAAMLCDESNKREYGAATPGNMPKLDKDDNHGADIRNVVFLDGHVVTFKHADAANAIFDNLVHPQVICSVD